MAMRVEFINPFIESIGELFQTMLGTPANRGKIGVSTGGGNPRDIVAVIGLSGSNRGTAAISFPTSTALRIVGTLLGRQMSVIDQDVSDGVAEVVNMVAGNAKAKLVGDDGEPMSLGLPTVLRGNSFGVKYPSQAVWLEVPFTSELGSFCLRVTFEAEP